MIKVKGKDADVSLYRARISLGLRSVFRFKTVHHVGPPAAAGLP